MTKTFKLSENLRRTIARVFLPILTVWLIAMPSQSYAVAPLALVPVVAIAAAADATLAGAGAAVAINAGMTAATGLITTMAAYFILTYPDGSQHRVPTTTDPTKQVPAPVAPSTATSTQTTGFLFVNWGGSKCSGGQVNYSGTDPAAACAALTAGTCSPANYAAGNFVTPYSFYCPALGNNLDAVTSQACPLGYSGIPCLIVDARAAAPDNKCDFGRSGGGFAMITDPDCAKNLNVKGNTDGSLDFTGKDANGRPVTVLFQPTAAGGTAVGISVQGADAAGNTVNTNLNLNVNPQGVIDGATQTQTTPSGAPASSPAVNPATGTTPATTTTPSTDYARQGEAAAATAPVTAELVKLNANYAPVTPIDPTVPLNADVPTFGNVFDNLFGFRLPQHTSACPTPTLTLTGLGMGIYTLDSHCNLLNSNYAPLRTSMIIVYLLSALFIVLRA
jgi:hypothetical protein